MRNEHQKQTFQIEQKRNNRSIHALCQKCRFPSRRLISAQIVVFPAQKRVHGCVKPSNLRQKQVFRAESPVWKMKQF